MKNQENPYCGAVVSGLGIVLPDPKSPGMYILPGGTTCNLQQAERAACKLHEIQAQRQDNRPSKKDLDHVV